MNEGDFNNLLKQRKEFMDKQKEDYDNKSRERLYNIASKKIQTTMIGAIDTIERIFGFLWNKNNDESIEMKELFDKARSEILDRGNNQIRNLQSEMQQYVVTWKRFNIVLPVRPLAGLVRRDQNE